MRTVVAAVLACVLLIGCAGGGADPVAEPAATPTPTATPAPPPTPVPMAIAPLTGVPLDDPAASTRPVLALKIDNHPRARPPTALRDADIVFEELVEGGVTRFIALYHSRVPDEVGPVRSGREVDADLLPAFEPVLGMSGAAPVVYGLLRGAGLTVFEEGQVGGFHRRPDLPAPHNLMADPSNLFAAGRDLPVASEPWSIDGAVPTGGTKISSAHVELSPYADADWRWDAGREQWLRSEDGVLHADALGGRQAADTVVVMEVATRPGSRTDSGGNRTVDIDVLGEGDATVLRDGRMFEARWRKDSPHDHIRWSTAAGDPLPLAPGQTWVELLPDSGSLTHW